MFKKDYLVITALDRFIIYDMKTWEAYDLKLPYTPAPNIPFYHYIWEMDDKDMKSLLPSGVETGGIIGTSFYVLIPDDALETDKNVIVEFFLRIGAKKVTASKQCTLLADWKSPYICLSMTSRLVVLSYIISGEVAAQNFYDKDRVDVSQLSTYISLLHQDCRNTDPQLYINNMWETGLPLDCGICVSLEEVVDRCHMLNA